MNESATKFCPVPQEQQPTQEYKQLQDSWFFSWGLLEFTDYIKKLLWVSLGALIITAPIAATSFLPTKYPIKFALCSSWGIVFFLSLVLFQLYFGWLHVKTRLYKDRISYEESGWYDGQIWVKPESMLTRDRLVVNYEIQPILDRIKKTFTFLFGMVIVGIIIWFV